MLQDVGRDGVGQTRKTAAVKRKRLVWTLGAQRPARQPELRAPAPGEGCDPAPGFDPGLVAAALAVERMVPSQSVVLVWIDLESVPQGVLRLGLVAALGKNLGEIGENDAALAVLPDEGVEHMLRLVEAAFLHQHDAPQIGRAQPLRIHVVEMFRGFKNVGAKAVIQRRDDETVELIWIVPSRLDRSRQHVGPPGLLGDKQLAPVLVIDLDEVRILLL